MAIDFAPRIAPRRFSAVQTRGAPSMGTLEASLGPGKTTTTAARDKHGWQDGRADFWDGDPSTQSFISCVGLSLSQNPRIRRRPSSAPVRNIANSRSPSPRHLLTSSRGLSEGFSSSYALSCDAGGGERPSTRARDEHSDGGDADIDRGRMRVLEYRLSELARENALLRDAMLEKADVTRMDRMAQAQRRNLELVAALHTAREAAEKKARKARDRARLLQVRFRTGCPETVVSGVLAYSLPNHL